MTKSGNPFKMQNTLPRKRTDEVQFSKEEFKLKEKAPEVKSNEKMEEEKEET